MDININTRRISDAVIRKKIILSGESCVGKTALLHSYADEFYQSYHNATIGCDYKTKAVLVDGMPVNLGIWDTAGKYFMLVVIGDNFVSINNIRLF